MPERLQHCGLIVADLERSRRFYGGALGLEEVPRPHNFRFEGAWFQVGGDQLHLLVQSEATHPGLKEHTWVIVEGHNPKNWGLAGKPWPVEQMPPAPSS